MTRFRRNVECEQARGWAALAPDEELSDLEQVSLRSHLDGCTSCRRFAIQVGHVSELLRSEKLVRPSSPTFVPTRAVRRRSLAARARPVAAAAAVALMAIGVASRAPLPVDERTSILRVTTAQFPGDQRELQSLRELRHTPVFVADLTLVVRPIYRWTNQPA